MTVLIKSTIPIWEDFTLEISTDTTIEQLKNLIAATKEIPAQVIRLYSNGVELEDSEPASQLEVVYLSLVLTLPI